MKFIKSLLSKLIIFAKRSANFVCYPQYSLFGIEFLFFIGLILYSIILEVPTFKLEVIKPVFNLGIIKSILNLGIIKSILSYFVIRLNLNKCKLYYLVVGLIVAFFKFISQKDFNYGSIKEQLNDTEGKGITLKTSTKLYRQFHWYFLVLSIFLFICKVFSIGDTFINDLGSVIGLIIFVFELFINYLAFSPYLFFLMMVVIPVIVNSIGSDKTILNWSFLLFIFVTIIGENFFEEELVKGRFSKKISVKNLIFRKISINIWVVFLYFGIVLSEKIVNSTYYYIYLISKADPIIAYLRNFVTKSFIFLLVFAVYLGTEKKIMYLIFRFYYRDKTLKNSEYLVKVTLDSEGKWKVNRKSRRYKDLNNLKRIGINTYQGKEKNEFYVEKNSEIPEKIEGVNENNGKNILGVVNVWTISWLLVMIPISIIFCYLDSSVKVDNGIYTTVEKSDNTDSSDIIEISDDTIIYNGKAETFDTRKQSFSMGKIEKNNGNNITIKFYKNGKEVQYKKD